MGDKSFALGPIALTNTLTTNLMNPPTATGGTNGGSSSQQIVLSQIRIANKTSSSATYSLWRGATGANAAGTEVGALAGNVPALGYIDLNFGYPGLKFDAADFLVGGGSANTTLTLTGVGVIRVAG